MKKFFKLFSILALAAVGAAAVGVGLSSKSEVKEAEAATYEYDVYVDVAGVDSGFSTVYLHNWGTDGTAWPGTAMTKVSGTLYGANLKNSKNNLCLFHDNTGDAHKTGDLGVELHKVFVMESNTGGVWQDLDEYFTAGDHASTNTMRIFVNNSDLSNWNSSSAVTKVRCWGSSSYTWAGGLYEVTWFQNKPTSSDGASNLWYGYADVPTDITGFAVVRCSNKAPRRVWNYAPDVAVSGSTAVAARIYKVQEYDWTFSYSSTIGDSKPGVVLMSNIIKAYNTCSSSKLNGWGAYNDLNTNFFSKATSVALNTEIKSLGGDKNYTISDHIAGLEAGYNSGSRPHSSLQTFGLFNLGENGDLTLAIVVISLVSVSAVAGVYFIRKRKHN